MIAISEEELYDSRLQNISRFRIKECLTDILYIGRKDHDLVDFKAISLLFRHLDFKLHEVLIFKDFTKMATSKIRALKGSIELYANE